MRLQVLSISLVVLGGAVVSLPSAAQRTRVHAGPRMLRIDTDDQPRAALGITTAGSTSARDTLGLLVSSVQPNSPAEKAGIEEGDRIASINGVNLRLDPPDAGDFDMSNAMSKRLTQELEKARPGDEVELRIYSGGETRTVHVRTTDSDSLYGRRALSRSKQEERGTLGIGIASTHTRRDTLGVLVMFVDDSGPAGQAGLEEGNRIASIDGVDLRVSREEAGDDEAAMAKVRRLERETARLHPGDDVEMRVYANGRFHTVQVRAARASDLSRRHAALMITGNGMGMPPQEFPPFGMDAALMHREVREAMEKAMQGAGRAMEEMRRGLDGARVHLQEDSPDEAPRAEPIEPLHIEPLEPSQLRLRVPAPLPRVRAAALGDMDDEMMRGAAVAMMDDAARSTGKSLDIAGLRMVPVGTELATYLGAGSERGLLVIDVPRWARDVLHAGDVVLRIDGRDVRPGSDEVTVALPRFREAQLDILRERVHHSVTLPARR
jgi:serine protease Do